MEKLKFSLTNKEITENFNDKIFHLMLSDFAGAMAYWIASHQQLSGLENIHKPYLAFVNYMKQKYFKTPNTVKEFTYDQLRVLISEDVFIAIPELLELNKLPTKEFYDLGALARNVFYMICREQITQAL